MASVEVRVAGTLLPGELTKVERADELLWSEGTGRSASTGTMTGTIVARKLTYQLEWGPMTQADYDAIRAAVNKSSFMSLTVKVAGSTVASATVYRSNVVGDLMGVIGGTAWYRDVAVQFVEA